MQRILYIFLLFLFPCLKAGASDNTSAQQPGEGTLPPAAVTLPYDLNYRPGLGYIRESEIPADWTFDADDFLRRYATAPADPRTGALPKEIILDLNFYYDDYVMYLDYDGSEGHKLEVERMKKAARKYKSKRLEDEVQYLEAFVIYRHVVWGDDISHGRRVADRLKREGKRHLALRMRYNLMRKANSGFDDLYPLAFRIATELLEELEGVTDEEFIYKKAAYGEIGHLHYTFGDYEKAVPLLRKALTDTVHNFFDRSNLRARNTLAVYYQSVDSLDRAREYFHSMLASPDSVYMRAMYNAIAWANLGHIAAKEGHCEQSLPLYEAALPISIATNDHNFAAGIIIGKGQCYLAQGDMEQTRQMIDTALVWIRTPELWVSTHRYLSLYQLIGKYHLRQGDIKTFELYADSTELARKNYQKVFNSRVILRAQNEVFQSEKQLRDEQIASQRRLLIQGGILGGTIIVLLALAFGIYIIYSRREAARVRSLMEQLARNERTPSPLRGTPPQRGGELAGYGNQTTVAYSDNPTGQSFSPFKGEMPEGQRGPENTALTADTDDLYPRIVALMAETGMYTKPTLTRNDVATALKSNENYLYKAIKQHTGLTFSEYLYYLRLEHARRLLEEPQNEYTIEAVATESGYRSRKTFHLHFRDRYGMTPDEYRSKRSLLS